MSAGASPILIFHGDKDPLVLLDQSTRFDEALRKAGVDSRLVVFNGQGHGFAPEFQERMKREALEFFNKHLQPKKP